MKNLIEKIAAGSLRAEIALVVSSSPAAARICNSPPTAGIPAAVVEPKQFASKSLQSVPSSTTAAGRGRSGRHGRFLKRVTIPQDFTNRVVNIHPGLIPAFCGEGFYGHRVHQAVLDYGAKISGCTVHFADNDYDHGPVILQRAVPVLDDDTADDAGRAGFPGRVRRLPRSDPTHRRRPRPCGREKGPRHGTSAGRCPIVTLKFSVSSLRLTRHRGLVADLRPAPPPAPVPADR